MPKDPHSPSSHNGQDDRLGVNEPISRRDFVNGVLLSGAGLLLHNKAPTISPEDAFNGYGGIGDYGHSNGNTWDVLTAGHAMRDGAFEKRIVNATDTGEIYDLVAVGGGISGLAAAIFFQKYKGGRALVIDNHPIFGGEAKRNEFRVDGQHLIAHQGSAIFLIPKKGGYTDQFYDMIGMDHRVFDYQNWRGPTPEIPVSHSPYDVADQKHYGFYFTSGSTGQPGKWVMDPWGRRLEGAPISESAKAELLRWGIGRAPFEGPKVEGDAISRQLDSITLEDHLIARYKISRETVRKYLSPTEGGGYGLGPDALSAYCNYAIENQFPEDGDETLGDQMFPDGNGGFARLMVKTLIPDAVAGPRSVDAVWQNRVNFRALDRAGQATRIRLNATVVRVEHAGDPAGAPHVVITYVKGGRLFSVKARAVVVAG